MGLGKKPIRSDVGAFLSVVGAKSAIVTNARNGFRSDELTINALVECSPFRGFWPTGITWKAATSRSLRLILLLDHTKLNWWVERTPLDRNTTKRKRHKAKED